MSYIHQQKMNKPAITKISDKLWNVIITVLPNEKANTIGRPKFHLEVFDV